MAKLNATTDAALGVLLDGSELERDVLDAPPSVLRTQLEEAAAAAGLSPAEAREVAAGAVDPENSAGLADVLITELSRNPEFAEELDAEARRREELMVIDPLSITAAALLLTILRVRRVRLSKKDGLDVSFDPIKPDVVKAVLAFLKGGAGG